MAKLILKKAVTLTYGQLLNKYLGMLIKYPDEAKVIDKETGLSRLQWIYAQCGNVQAAHIARFADYLDTGGQLDGRSWYLMVDMYKISAYMYEREGTTLIRDDSFDRLAKFLQDNIQQLIDRQIIPHLINREAIQAHTGMDAAYALTDKDISLAKTVETTLRSMRHGNQKTDDKPKSKRVVIRSPSNPAPSGQDGQRTYRLVKRITKK